MDGAAAPPKYVLHTSYAAAVTQCGGLPLPLPFVDPSLAQSFVQALDGLVFTGGDDLDPGRYGQPLHPRAVPIDPNRERFEFALMDEARKARLPTLCICLGFQLLNVHRGGSLLQFLPEHARPNAIEHRRLDLPSRRHEVRIATESVLGRSLGKPLLSVNTSHKQGIDRVGDGLRVSAVAPDGIIEALEDPSLPFCLGVQWHPERLLDEPDHLALFGLLLEHCSPRH